jgi:hypothetical protein
VEGAVILQAALDYVAAGESPTAESVCLVVFRGSFDGAAMRAERLGVDAVFELSSPPLGPAPGPSPGPSPSSPPKEVYVDVESYLPLADFTAQVRSLSGSDPFPDYPEDEIDVKDLKPDSTEQPKVYRVTFSDTRDGIAFSAHIAAFLPLKNSPVALALAGDVPANPVSPKAVPVVPIAAVLPPVTSRSVSFYVLVAVAAVVILFGLLSVFVICYRCRRSPRRAPKKTRFDTVSRAPVDDEEFLHQMKRLAEERKSVVHD